MRSMLFAAAMVTAGLFAFAPSSAQAEYCPYGGGYRGAYSGGFGPSVSPVYRSSYRRGYDYGYRSPRRGGFNGPSYSGYGLNRGFSRNSVSIYGRRGGVAFGF